jgi:glycosyltransferase involved in cell wall biosynthesis
MSAHPLISVIVPCYVTTAHQAALLDETLRTVADQTSQSWELVVVDDGSPLPIEETVAAYGGTLVRQINGGSAAARNTGIAQARGEYLVFLDADDHLLPSALDVAVGVFAAHPDSGFVVGPHEEMTFDGVPVPWTVEPPPLQTQLYHSLLGFDWYIIPPSAAMFRREVVETIGGFRDPWGADDLDFYLRAAYTFEAWCYQVPAVTRYRRYSQSSSRDGERMLHSTRAVYERNWETVRGNPVAEEAWHRGLQQLTNIFLDCVVENFVERARCGDHARATRSAQLLRDESPERWTALLTSGDPAALAFADERGAETAAVLAKMRADTA